MHDHDYDDEPQDAPFRDPGGRSALRAGKRRRGGGLRPMSTKKRKRPPKPRRAAEMSKRKVSTRLTTAELVQLDRVAARLRVTRSEALRRCVLSEALRSELPSDGGGK